MGARTGIEWADATWSPVRGCSRVSPGCERCYAETLAGRFSGEGQAWHGFAERRLHVVNADEVDAGNRLESRWTRRVELIPSQLSIPLRWKKSRRIFVDSMSDTFHEKLANEEIAAIFGVMAACPRHTFMVLTKRAKRMREWFEWVAEEAAESAEMESLTCVYEAERRIDSLDALDGIYSRWPLPNVELGVSVEDQQRADERVPYLMATPARRRFLSMEPLLEEVDLFGPTLGGQSGIDLIIAGCESGRDARPCDAQWLRRARDDAKAMGASFFAKQATEADGVTFGAGSTRKPGGVIGSPYLDGKQYLEIPSW